MIFREKLAMRKNHEREILFDLDGTLFEKVPGPYQPTVFGAPYPEMIALAKAYIQQGFDVKIFTARLDMDTPEGEKMVAEAIMDLCREHGLVTKDGNSIPVTRQKGRRTYMIFDDIARQARHGKLVGLAMAPGGE